MNKDDYIVIDIESAPQKNPDPFLVDYFRQRKWAKKQKSEEVEEVDRIIEPTLAEVICCCVKSQDDLLAFTGEEKDILTQFWDLLSGVYSEYPRVVLVTFNGINFDFPFINMRSKILGISNFNLPVKRYDTSKHFDIRMVLTNWDTYGLGDLTFWCHVFGIERNPDVIKSDQVVNYYLQGNINAVVDHCKDDALSEEKLYLKIR